ncbi:MAG: hypothetical protein QM783_16500 [Phycisphaerales bacterium]
MAVRGINPLEKHVEKIFLALAAAGLTGVVAWQVAGGSGTVKVNGADVQADQAYASLESKAKTLQTQMRDPNPPLSDKLKGLVDPREAFKKNLAANVAPSKQLDYQPNGPKIAVGGINSPTDGNYAVPNLPASIKPIAHAFMSTVSEAEIAAYPELAKYMPAKAPMDKAAVSVQTTIDPKAIRACARAGPRRRGSAAGAAPCVVGQDRGGRRRAGASGDAGRRIVGRRVRDARASGPLELRACARVI